jgi:hypothetical protein
MGADAGLRDIVIFVNALLRFRAARYRATTTTRIPVNKLLLVLALASSPFAASATELNYSYVEGGYARVTLDGIDGDLDFDGYQLRGSAAVA